MGLESWWRLSTQILLCGMGMIAIACYADLLYIKEEVPHATELPICSLVRLLP